TSLLEIRGWMARLPLALRCLLNSKQCRHISAQGREKLYKTEATSMGAVIMLSGPIGAGKTTVARELISLLPGPISCIEGDMFWSFIAKSKSEDRRENFRIIM